MSQIYVLWICDGCGDHSECEPGDKCEVCCEGTIREVQMVALRGVVEALAECKEALLQVTVPGQRTPDLERLIDSLPDDQGSDQ